MPKFRLTPEKDTELQAIFEGREDAKRPTLTTCYPADAVDVIEHAARLSCIVGKAQKLLGAKVTIKAG